MRDQKFPIGIVGPVGPSGLQGPSEEEDVLESAEISVWMTGFGCLSILQEIQAAQGPISSENLLFESKLRRSINGELRHLAKVAEATHRFGVLMPCTIQPKRFFTAKGEASPFLGVKFYSTFWRWFNWWGDYVDGKTKAEIAHLYRLALEGLPEIDQYRPSGHWLDHRADVPGVLSFLASP
jgi:hypothetical protein